MSTLKRFTASTSAVALAAGTMLAGAGFASAQDDSEESTGSLSSSSLNLGDTVGDLETASEALNGPVTVTPNEEGGPTLSYLNESDADQRCLGFTAPYSTIEENDLDTDYDEDDLLAAIALIQALEGGGDASLLDADEDGASIAYEDPDPEANNNIVQLAIPIALATDAEAGVLVPAGETVEWTAPTPDTPAVGAALCAPLTEEENEDGEMVPALGPMETNLGIDPQVVADQINSKIPGGSVAPVSAGSISGGSVEMGVAALGSLAGGGDEEEPPVEEPAE